ncbi:energy transducer TonB [Occallatibacter savannae]|uniref:energy transducer TonB n=1 Tax=Occallatibacter savannae TaxID=1002691 RepID=UPI000D69D2F5|nr:energy transducer TonB [Occallatibacter savannae]
MRNVVAVCAIFSSVLLHAQPVAKGSSVNLEARNNYAGVLYAHGESQPSTDASSNAQPLRISSGVVWPKLISEPSFKVSSSDFNDQNVSAHQVVVSFTVDERGKPQNVHLTKSANPTVDERVLNAVRQYRYLPATLNDQKVAVDINLEVNFAKR